MSVRLARKSGPELVALMILALSCGESSGGANDPHMLVPKPQPVDRFHPVQYVEVPDHRASLIETLYQRAFVDMNGDGLLDLIAAVLPESEPGIQRATTLLVSLNEGGRMGPLGEWALPAGAHLFGVHDSLVACEDGLSWRISDLDGDGRPDFVVTGPGSREGSRCSAKPFGGEESPHWLLFRNLGDRFSDDGQVFPLPSWREEFIVESEGFPDYDLRDMDGDGLPDLVITWSHTLVPDYSNAPNPHWLVLRNNGSSFEEGTIWPLPPGGLSSFGFAQTAFNGSGSQGMRYGYGESWLLEDMDGDGRPDLVVTGMHLDQGGQRLPGYSDSPHWLVYPNTGSGFGEERALPVPAQSAYDMEKLCEASRDPGPWTLVDVNGDGLLDLLGFGIDGADSQWRIHRSEGFDFAARAQLWSLPEEGLGQGHSGVAGALVTRGDPHRRWTTVDLNGDGLVDLVSMDADLRSRTPGAPEGAHWRVYYQKPVP